MKPNMYEGLSVQTDPRRKGIPRSDIERAIAHYGITGEEYVAHPESYPLPERGSGLVTFVASPEVMGTWSGSLLSIPAPYTGRITNVLIRRGSTDYPVPATIPLNSSIELAVYGYLDAMSPAVKCGMRAVVTAPGKSPVTWVKEMITKQDPGQTLRFDIKSFFADTPGVWTAYIEYYAIPYVLMDVWTNKMLTAGEIPGVPPPVPPPEEEKFPWWILGLAAGAAAVVAVAATKTKRKR